MTTFESTYSIQDNIQFMCPIIEQMEFGMTNNWKDGEIVSVTFTGLSILYNIFSREYNRIFYGINENNIK